MSKCVTMIVVGAGARGNVYARFAKENPERLKIVGVAEPNDISRNYFQQLYNLPKEHVWSDWKELLSIEKYADCVAICTQDHGHVEPAVALANLKYHILLEKPMAVTEDDCKRVVEAVKKNNVFFAVCHVLRYTPMTKKVKQMIRDNELGDILNIQHLEPVGYYHYAHSYVRGNWCNVKKSSFMLMTKSCHDMDWISYVIGEKCTKIDSFGALKHFRKENKPKTATSRCLNCPVEKECVYSAKKIYLELGFSTERIMPWGKTVDIESITDALNNTDYGRCVYDSDNDVVDNQVVIMEFESKATATFTMVATTKDICIRKTRIFGTKGQLEIDGGTINHFDFLSGKTTIHVPEGKQPKNSKMVGHEGADWFLMDGFVTAIEKNDASFILSGPDDTLNSHLMVFEAEKMRLK
jgi:predicted dehydrogenase